MYILAILALAAGILLSAMDLWPSATAGGAATSAPKLTAAAQVEKFRVFIYAADEYMKASPPAVTVDTAVSWATIRTLGTLPESVRQTQMPDGWKIVRSADNSWVGCTEMDEAAMNAVHQRVSTPGMIASGGMSLQALNGVMQKIPMSVTTPPFDVVPVSVAGGTATVAQLGTTPRTVNYTVLGTTAEAPAAALKCTTS